MRSWLEAVWRAAGRPKDSGALLECFGVTVAVKGLGLVPPDHHPCVLVNLNQQTIVGSLAVRWALAPFNPHFVVNLGWRLHPFGWGPDASRYIMFKAHEVFSAQNRAVIDRCAADLRSGIISKAYISAEGRRYPGATVGRYFKGAAILAIKAGRIPLVPVIIRGSDNLMPFGEWRIKPGEIQIHILDPIKCEGTAAELTNKFKYVYEAFCDAETSLKPQ